MCRLTLSEEDLIALTGLTQASAQIRWLNRNGWIFAVGADGLPKVASAYFERRMVHGDNDTDDAGMGQAWEINAFALQGNPKN